MKILIVSDSHGDTAALRQAIARENPGRVFHLGDVNRDAQRMAEAFPALPLDAVLGNCDAYSGGEGPEELLASAGGVKFFLTHGHRFHVKMGTALLFREGLNAGADVICFGHTPPGGVQTEKRRLAGEPRHHRRRGRGGHLCRGGGGKRKRQRGAEGAVSHAPVVSRRALFAAFAGTRIIKTSPASLCVPL